MTESIVFDGNNETPTPNDTPNLQVMQADNYRNELPLAPLLSALARSNCHDTGSKMEDFKGSIKPEKQTAALHKTAHNARIKIDSLTLPSYVILEAIDACSASVLNCQTTNKKRLPVVAESLLVLHC